MRKRTGNNALVAQLVERLTLNQNVVGSIPSRRTNFGQIEIDAQSGTEGDGPYVKSSTRDRRTEGGEGSIPSLPTIWAGVVMVA